MEILQLTQADRKTLQDINTLLGQISARPKECSPELFEKIISSEETELWIVREEEKTVGMATLVLIYRPEGIAARVEDVVVHGEARGKGYGTLLLEKLTERAKARGAAILQLTSSPSRTAANALYQKLGFSIHDTNCYEMRL